MNKQKYFNFKFTNEKNELDFYINDTNFEAYDGIINKNNQNLFLTGPRKSGKSHIESIWLKKNNAIKYENNFEYLIKNNFNILIENLNKKYDQEKIFHIINHSKLYGLNIFITSNYSINELDFSLEDLTSRLKTFSFFEIKKPDDDMLLNILTKLFIEKQFIINSHELFTYIIKRANRSYEEMLIIVEKLDSLSLEKKRQLTIPLIKEIL